MAQRIITILIASPVILWLLSFNQPPYGTLPSLIFFIAIIILGVSEMMNMIDKKHPKPLEYIVYSISLLLMLTAFFSETVFLWNSIIFFIISIGVVGLSMYELYKKEVYFISNPFYSTIRTILYLGWCGAFMVLIRNLPAGGAFTFFIIFGVWAGDSAAYVLGIKYGKHKLNSVSPKKSIEGAIAGAVATILVSIFLATPFIGFVHAVVISLIMAFLGQAGDLYESLLKRTCHVKDSGEIVPGHGGILDRLDSFILLFPIIYYYLLFFGLDKI